MPSIQQTHQLLFKYLSDEKVNELLYRVDQNILRNDLINNISGLTHIPYKININEKTKYIIDRDNKDISNLDINIYIKYIDISSNIEIGHITFHLTGTNFSNKKAGLFHVKNTSCSKEKYIIFRVSFDKTDNQVKLIYPPENLTIINNDLQILSKHTLDILNRYLSDNIKETYSLLHKRAKYYYKHKYLENILSTRNYTNRFIPRILSKKSKTARRTLTRYNQGSSFKPKSTRNKTKRYKNISYK